MWSIGSLPLAVAAQQHNVSTVETRDLAAFLFFFATVLTTVFSPSDVGSSGNWKCLPMPGNKISFAQRRFILGFPHCGVFEVILERVMLMILMCFALKEVFEEHSCSFIAYYRLYIAPN